MATRILEDFLTIPVYLIKDYQLPNGNLSVRIHVNPFQEPIEERVQSIDAPISPIGKMRSYPAIDLDIEISRLILDTLHRAYPTVNNARDEWGFFDADMYEQKAKEFRQLQSEYLNGVARMIVGLWQKEVKR